MTEPNWPLFVNSLFLALAQLPPARRSAVGAELVALAVLCSLPAEAVAALEALVEGEQP